MSTLRITIVRVEPDGTYHFGKTTTTTLDNLPALVANIARGHGDAERRAIEVKY